MSLENKVIRSASAVLAAAALLGNAEYSFAEEAKKTPAAENAAVYEDKDNSSQSTEEQKAEPKVIKANIDASFGVSLWWINGVMNQSGWFYDIESLFGARITPALGVEAQLEVNGSPYEFRDEDASGNVTEITAKLEARLNSPAEKDVVVFGGLGAELWNYDESISYLGEEISLKQQTLGPVISAGLEWTYLDIIAFFSVGFGQKDSSFEMEKKVVGEKLELKAVPKYSLFHCPILFRYSNLITSEDSGPNDQRYTIGIKPGIDIYGPLSGFLNGEYTEVIGSTEGDKFRRFDLGGGLGAKW